MAEIRICQLNDARHFAELAEFFHHENPRLRLTLVDVQGAATLHAEHAGMRVFWLFRGTGEVFLPRGYRTQEGDGAALPHEYVADPLEPSLATTLRLIEERMTSLSSAAAVPASAITNRRRGAAFVGDFAGELWKLDHAARPWSSDPKVERALNSLYQAYRQHGFSTKGLDSWEPLTAGDQLIACGAEEIRVQGSFQCLSMENLDRSTSHVSQVRRLRFLADTAGGCNPDFAPFRRLPLTWFYNYPDEAADGLNWVNSHVVNIPKETSPAHFHPPKAIGGEGGTPQREMYLVLDPQAYQLNTFGRPASLIVLPDLLNLKRYEEYALEPGTFVYIPPGTGHRGLDVFVNVLTIPGFKPHNEYYIDRDIRDVAGGQTPYNENLLHAKNYARIEDLLY